MGRKDDMKDYEREPSTYVNGKEVKGKWKYKGKYYTLGLSGKELKKAKAWLAWLFLLMTAVLCALGMINSVISRLWYVMLPYAVMLIPALVGLLDSVMFFFEKGDRWTRQNFDKEYGQTRTCAWALAILSGVHLLGTVVAMIVNGAGQMEVMYLMCALLPIGISVLMVLFIRKYPGGEEKMQDNQAKDAN